MKVNLTKLLESSKRIRQVQQDDADKKTCAQIVVTNYESTSSERAYSFELEKEMFSLER
jgi:hypothetical protein